MRRRRTKRQVFRPCLASPLPVPRLAARPQALGDALSGQACYEEAVACYKEAIAAPGAPDDVVKHSRKNASHLLHFHLGRPEEADAL